MAVGVGRGLLKGWQFFITRAKKRVETGGGALGEIKKARTRC